MPSCSWRDRHTRCSVDAAGVVHAPGYGLIAGRLQDEAISPSVGTGIRRSEGVVIGKYGCRIGTGEMYEVVDNRVPLFPDRHGHGNGKGRTCGRSGRSCEIENRVRVTAADRHRYYDRSG